MLLCLWNQKASIQYGSLFLYLMKKINKSLLVRLVRTSKKRLYAEAVNTYCFTMSRTSLRRFNWVASCSHSEVILFFSNSRFTTKSCSYFSLPQTSREAHCRTTVTSRRQQTKTMTTAKHRFTTWHDGWLALKNRQASCEFNLAHKLKTN